ncbi:MAG: molybdopterin molybdotransferase MoeA [Thermodesulfobacteriota bacterium]
MKAMPTLAQAQRLILSTLAPLPSEEVPLPAAAGRVAAAPLTAKRAVPDFARSSMDGFAIHSSTLAATGRAELVVIGEIAAGATILPSLRQGSAIRIMTGGAVPPGADQVVPVEQCRFEEGRVLIAAPPRSGAFIRQAGADLRRGRTIVAPGRRIEPQHLPLLAESGCETVAATTRPRLAILCTGSELLEASATPLRGQIVGGNRFLLDALARRADAAVSGTELAVDDLDTIVARLEAALASPADLIITTGGMGPGKYDLLPQAFERLGIQPLYRQLAVRPGRSTMFGLAGGKPLFALPGPPPAVFPLFHELVLPALNRLQGLRRPLGQTAAAVLAEPLSLNKTGILNLKAATARLEGTTLVVRASRAGETANAIIHIPANRRHLRAGETVRLRLCGLLA